MTVQTAKDRLEKRGEIYLDAELDFRSVSRKFCRRHQSRRGGAFQAIGVRQVSRSIFGARHIRAKGVVTVVDDVPRIEVSDPETNRVC